MNETQVLMTVSDFSGFCSRNHFLEGGSIFNGGASFLSEGASHGGGIGFDGEGFQKVIERGGPYLWETPLLWETIISLSKIAHQMWRDHTFSKRNKTTKFEKGGRQYRGGGLFIKYGG